MSRNDADHRSYSPSHELSALLALKSDLAAIKMGLAFDRLEQLQLEQRYSDSQPRGGNGRWINTGAGRAASALWRRVPIIAAAAAAYEHYEHLSQLNNDKQRAVAKFVSRDYRPEEQDRLIPRQVAMLERDEVKAACPRLDEVEARTQEAMDRVRREKPELTGAQLGTAVHLDLSRQINALDKLDFVAERSFLKDGSLYGMGSRTVSGLMSSKTQATGQSAFMISRPEMPG